MLFLPSFNGTLCVSLKNRDRPIEQAARDKIAKHRNLYNLLPGDLGFLPLVVSTSGRLDEEAGHEADAAGGRRDRDFLIQRSRFLAALKTRLGLILAKAVAMRVMINATGCPAPVLDRNRMNTNTQAPFPTALSSVPLGLPLWASLSAFSVLVIQLEKFSS